MAGPLTKRERQVLILVAQSKTNKEIAHELRISIKTVETHMTHILGKLDAVNRTGAVMQAVEQGEIEPEDIWATGE